MALEKEWETFQRELPGLLQDPANRGKYALIKGDKVDSIWPTVDEGLQAGYDRFGLDPFMVQEINDKPEPRYFSHRVTRCP
jgi:hypothetical protein